jgi:prolipoprotein diacylglyceryl transferase
LPSPSDPVAFTIGSLELRWYAIFILAGIIAGISVARWIARLRGQDDTFILDAAPIVVLFAVIGARIYYVLLGWRFFIDHPDEIIGLQLRGLTIHGALIGGIACFWWLCRRRGESPLWWADTVIVGVPVGQAIGRWGNWANQEAFGRPSSLPWAVEIDFERRPLRYLMSDRFHPTFLYESILSLFIALALAWLVLRYGESAEWRNGYALAAYLIMYGGARLLIEPMRTDSLYIGPWPAAYWFSIALIVAGAALVLWRRSGRVQHS